MVEWAKPRATTLPTVQVTAIARADVAGNAVAVAQANVHVHVDTDEPPESSESAYAIQEKLGLALAKSGGPFSNLDNGIRVLERHPDFANFVWFDEFHQKLLTDWKVQGRPREWENIDTLNLTAYMQRDMGITRLSDEIVFKAVTITGHRHKRNDPRDWMDSLQWDGTARVENFFMDCFGVKDTDYSQAVSRNFWVGMVARIYRPGCQLDNMVVLEGSQGIGKTRALRMIGGSWYTEAHESVTSNDFFMMLHGKLIVEIAELDAFSRAEVTRIKQVVSCTTDRYRAPYERKSEDHPRMSIFVGTTNERSYLRDQTGARRFWPLQCGEIRHDKIVADRNQLFAEAVALFKSGADWYQMPKGTTEQEQENRRQSDAWEDVIHEYTIGKSEVTTIETRSRHANADRQHPRQPWMEKRKGLERRRSAPRVAPERRTLLKDSGNRKIEWRAEVSGFFLVTWLTLHFLFGVPWRRAGWWVFLILSVMFFAARLLAIMAEELGWD